VRESYFKSVIDGPGDIWFFVYGSLMWNPGFNAIETQKAKLNGWQRKFCVSSETYRGTPNQPGLSLGLDVGGECEGLALRIAETDREKVFDYLNNREMLEEIYRCVPVAIELDDHTINAYTLVVNRDHALYVGEISIEKTAERILDASGKYGSNRDYLAATVKHLEGLGLKDKMLTTLLRLVDQSM